MGRGLSRAWRRLRADRRGLAGVFGRGGSRVRGEGRQW